MNSLEVIPHRPEADSFDLRLALRRVLEATRTYKWMVLGTMVLTLVLAGLYVVIWPPIYKADVLIVADAKDDASRDSFYQLWSVFRKDSLESEAEMMTSRAVLGKVVRELNLKFDDVYHPFLTHAAYLWTESWVGKRYKGLKNTIFPPQTSPYKPTKEEEDFAKTVEAFRNGVALQPIAESTAGYLRLRGPSPRVAEIANKLMDTYLEERRARHLREATEARDSLKAEVDRSYEVLVAAELRAKDYANANGMLLEFEKDKVEVARSIESEAAAVDLRSSIAALEKSRIELASQLEKEERENVSTRTYAPNTLRETLKAQKVGLRTALDQLLLHYKPDSPEVADVKAQIVAIENKIGEQDEKVETSSVVVLSNTHEEMRARLAKMDSELVGSKANLVVREKALGEIKDRINRLPEKLAMAHTLSRDSQMAEQKYGLLHEKLIMAEVSMATAASVPESMRIADRAAAPSKQAWPNSKLVFGAAGAVGLCAGIALAVLLDMLRGRVTRDKLAMAGVDFPLYAVLDFPQAGDMSGRLLGSGANRLTARPAESREGQGTTRGPE